MLKKILIGLVVVLVVLIAVIASRPAEFEIKRSLLINAPAEVVFAQVDNFKAWNGWSPWDKRDPAMKRTYGDTPSGKGATYHWVGNNEVGEGRMTITDAKPNEHIGIDLEFIKPFPAKNRTDFHFTPTGTGTTVNWVMTGKNDFMGKAFSMVMDMDKMVGPDFEAGLAQMKTVSEVAAAKAASDAAAAADAADAAAAETPDAGSAATP